MQYVGFSVARPSGASWYLMKGEQHRSLALLRRDVAGPLPHSFVFEASLARLAREPASPEDFAALARPVQKQEPERFEVVSYREEPAALQGQWCIRYESTTRDRAAPAAPAIGLTVVTRGMVCRHPRWPATVVTMRYSERGLPGGLDPSLYAEGEELLLGTRLEGL